MNVFTTPGYLETIGELYHPGKRRTVERFTLEGRVLRLLVLDGRGPMVDLPFYDYPQPLEGEAAAGPTRPLGYLPRTVVRTTPIEERTAPEPPGFQPSPYVDWSRFPDYAAYEALLHTRGTTRTADIERKRRKLERDVGPVRFLFDDPRPEAFEACLRWKSAQYKATGLGDMFADARNVELFRRLRALGLVVVSSLSAGERLLAVHLGSLNDRRFGWWVPAYDPEFSRFSPGRLMMLELLKESHRLGHLEFDFLIGAEDYKFAFATHNRVIGPVGTPPLLERLKVEGTRRLKAWLQDSPRAYELARQVKRRLWRPPGT
jgi:CelD/BcsL family acetyltransferase involved in cellulose biosynthesis